jgi:hypothetical protein
MRDEKELARAAREYLAKIGSKGGSAGRGDAKRRTPKQYRALVKAAAEARKAKAKAKQKESKS